MQTDLIGAKVMVRRLGGPNGRPTSARAVIHGVSDDLTFIVEIGKNRDLQLVSIEHLSLRGPKPKGR